MKYTHIVFWQWAEGENKAGDIVSRHTSLLAAENKAASYWAWAVLSVAG
jgi:hypothetical protein